MLTHEEVIEQFGDVLLEFSSYYKYTFTYDTTVNDYYIVGKMGGDSGEICKMNVYPGQQIPVNEYTDFYQFTIYKKNEVIFHYEGD